MIRSMGNPPASRGFTLLEVLITVVILAIGLLGLAGLQMNSLNAQLEAYQRAQALLILEDMANRMRANAAEARTETDYPEASDYGSATPVNDCAADASNDTTAKVDLCEWNKAVLGTGVKLGSKNVGSAVGAVGCIEYRDGSIDGETVIRLTIAWQGMTETISPPSDCGRGQFGEDRNRRVASIDTVLADLAL